MTSICTARGEGFTGAYTTTLAAMQACAGHADASLEWDFGPGGSLVESHGRYVIAAPEPSLAQPPRPQGER